MNSLAATLLAPVLLGTAIAGCGSETSESTATASTAAIDRPAAEGRRSSRSGDIEVLGTIRATVDGDPRTWYVVDGKAKSGRYASAVWFALDEVERMVTVGGYDTERPPLHTFDLDVDPGQVSLGDYVGSAIVVVFTAPNDAAQLSIDLEEPEKVASVAYMPVATLDPSGTFIFGPGSLQVTHLSFRGGKARVEGRFEAILRTMQGEGPIRIEDGRFEVSSIPAREELER